MLTAGFVSLCWFGVDVNSGVCLSLLVWVDVNSGVSLCWFGVDVNSGVVSPAGLVLMLTAGFVSLLVWC